MRDSLKDLVESISTEALVDRPGWLHAGISSPEETGEGFTVLAVYRSVLVGDTDSIYQPVSELLLSCERVSTVVRRKIKDTEMMFGEAEYMLLLLDSRKGSVV